MEYTKGPWKIDIGQVAPLFEGGKLQEAVFSENECIAICGENQANARLISAAPDLLESLKWAMEHVKDSGVYDGEMADKADEAIAKAEGV